MWILAFLEEVKLNDPYQGAYIESHLIFDDENETMIYTGTTKIIEFILMKSTVEECTIRSLDTLSSRQILASCTKCYMEKLQTV